MQSKKMSFGLGLLAALMVAAAPAAAATVDLADVLAGGTEYTVTDLSANDSYTYTGATTVNLILDLASDAGYTGTISGKIRLVKRGSGTLTLSAANTYTGGTKIEQGILGISNANALGAEPVDIVATTVASSPSRLRIDAAMTFANDIAVSGGKVNSAETAIATFEGLSSIYININANVMLSGDITATCDLYVWDISSGNRTRTFSGMVSADGYNIETAPNGSTYIFSGGVKAATFYAQYLYLHMGSVQFQTTNTDIGKLTMAYTKVNAYGVLNEDIWLYQTGSTESVRTIVYLYGDLTVGKWTTDSVPANHISGSGRVPYKICCNPAATARTLTIKASASGTSYGTLCDSVSLVYDPTSADCVQTLTAPAALSHPTTGSLTVKGGTLEVKGYISMPNLTEISVADNAAFVVDTKGATAFAGVTNIAVGAGATFSCAGNTEAPFAEGQTKLAIGEGASVTLPAGETFIVTELWRAGKRLTGGTYTPDGANGTKALAELKQGTVYVPTFAGETQALTWTGAAGTDVEAAANWKENEAPDWAAAGAELTFAANGSVSTAAIFANTSTVKRIIFRQPLGFTLGAGGSGLIRLLDGITFGDTGGAAPTNTIDAPLEIVGGQVWNLPDDDGSVFTLSKPLVSGVGAAGDSLTVTGNVGTLNFFTTNSTFTGSLVAQAKTMNIQGENVFGLADKGGTVALKLNHHGNTAKCWFRGCTVSQPLTCTMPINNVNYAVFDCAANTTNVFNGNVTMPAWSQFDDGSTTIFNGGAVFSEYTRQRIGKNATVVFRENLSLTGYFSSRTFDPSPLQNSGEHIVVFECPVTIANPANHSICARDGITLDFRYDHALGDGVLLVWGLGLVQLNGHSQQVRSVGAGAGTISSTNGPAFLELNLAAGAAQTNSLKFTGLAGFRMVGDGFVRLDGDSSTAGALAVDAGTVEMGLATWTNATSVAIGGDGRLKLTRAKTFDRKTAALAFTDGGTIEVPEGVVQGFSSAAITANGETIRVTGGGPYGVSRPGPFAGHLAGAGAIRIGDVGTTVVLR